MDGAGRSGNKVTPLQAPDPSAPRDGLDASPDHGATTPACQPRRKSPKARGTPPHSLTRRPLPGRETSADAKGSESSSGEVHHTALSRPVNERAEELRKSLPVRGRARTLAERTRPSSCIGPRVPSLTGWALIAHGLLRRQRWWEGLSGGGCPRDAGAGQAALGCWVGP